MVAWNVEPMLNMADAVQVTHFRQIYNPKISSLYFNM